MCALECAVWTVGAGAGFVEIVSAGKGADSMITFVHVRGYSITAALIRFGSRVMATVRTVSVRETSNGIDIEHVGMYLLSLVYVV